MYQKRFYRDLFKNELIMLELCIGQTDLVIGCESDLAKVAQRHLRKVRSIIMQHIKENPLFEKTLKPMETHPDYNQVINEMILAGISAGTGPMAAVAGAISQYIGERLLKISSQVFIENGGDIYFASSKQRIIGIYAGESPLSNRIGIKISADMFPIGICTSSGTVGHSLSFGSADAVTVISKKTALADAVATAAGNIVKKPEDIKKALNFGMGVKGVDGILVIVNDKIGAAGSIELAAL